MRFVLVERFRDLVEEHNPGTSDFLIVKQSFRLNKSWVSEGKWFASLQVLHRDYKKYNT